jgi:hypothetical protein
LGRTPDAPEGVKGISLFIVPKFLVNDDGSIGARNDVRAVSLEHKIGIHGSPTAVLSFGDNGNCVGYLVGDEGRGLEYMFMMMNNARLNVGLQGVALAERAYQQALGYARDRVQGKPLGQAAKTPIVDHPDVRRLLFTMKARIEAMRAIAYVEAAALDHAEHGKTPEQKKQGQLLADFLNPIVKGWCTENGVQVCASGVQVHGGMGFIEETGAGQHYRDVRIITIYEGTTAIQANDLINRKLMRDKGMVAKSVLAEVAALAEELQGAKGPLSEIGAALAEGNDVAETAVDWVLNAASEDPRLPAAASVPLLMLLGTVLGGYQMARAAKIATAKLANGAGSDKDYLTGKVATAHHYALHVLPEALSYARNVTQGSRTVMEMPAELL